MSGIGAASKRLDPLELFSHEFHDGKIVIDYSIDERVQQKSVPPAYTLAGAQSIAN
jgi:hypothetical protein